MPALLDPHAHLSEATAAGELEALLRRAAEAGVSLVVSASAKLSDWEPARRREKNYSFGKSGEVRVWEAFGIHPWHARQNPPDWETSLRRALAEGELPLIGEIGLDYGSRGLASASKLEQQPLFLRQLEIADELAAPAVVHSFRAGGEVFEAAGGFKRIPCILFHGYLEPVPRAKMEERFFFSFSPREAGIGRRKGREAVRRLAEIAPEQILAESDYPARGQEPAGIPQTAEWLRELGARPLAAAERFLAAVRKKP